MVRGLPDDSNIVKQGAVYGLDDQGELASRLGSPVNYIRFGDVYMMDEFDCGLGGWARSVPAFGSLVSLSGTYFLSKGVSMRLATGTALFPIVSAQRTLPLALSPKLGFSIAFMLGDHLDTVTWALRALVNEYTWYYYIHYNLATNVFTYDDDGGLPVPFANLNLNRNMWPFHLFKLVIDTSTHTYLRVYIDNYEYNLGGALAQNTAAAGQADYLRAFISALGDGVLSGDCWFDNAVVTQNEF